MKIDKVNFNYKGERSYVHGPDIFDLMLSHLKSSETDTCKNICFTVHDYVYVQNCLVYSTTDKSKLKEISNISSRCQLDIDGKKYWLAITEDNINTNSENRTEYDENKVISLCKLGEEFVELVSTSPYSFIETTVAMTKHMHKNIFTEVEGDWAFTRIDLPTECKKNDKLTVRLKHNMNYKLTKSDIEVEGVKVGDIYFSLVAK